MEADLTWGSEHTMQHTYDVLQNCTPKTYITLLTNVTPINSIQRKKEIRARKRKSQGEGGEAVEGRWQITVNTPANYTS